MGYRSDVTAVFYCNAEEDYPSMKLFVEENIGGTFKEDLRELEFKEHKCLKFYLEDVKWNDTHVDVTEFNGFIKKFKELADGEGGTLSWAYEFVRIGEELDDILFVESDGAQNVLTVYRGVEIAF
jgi:hypothetical protein